MTNLLGIYNQIPPSSCPTGCGDCCGPVFPSRAEIKKIRRWCLNKGIEYKEFLKTGDDGVCPYLMESKLCLIYPVRPFMCRIYGVAEHRLLKCDKCIPSSVLNQRITDYLYGKIYKGEQRRIEKHRASINSILENYLSMDVGNGRKE